MGGIRQLGRGKQDGNRPVSPVAIGFGLWRWMVLDKKITARKQLDFTVRCDGETQTRLLIDCLLNILFLQYLNIPPIYTSQNFRQGFCCSHDTRAGGGCHENLTAWG